MSMESGDNVYDYTDQKNVKDFVESALNAGMLEDVLVVLHMYCDQQHDGKEQDSTEFKTALMRELEAERGRQLSFIMP